MKNHQVAQLVNVIRDAVEPHCKPLYIREVISRAVYKYLLSEGLLVDCQTKKYHRGQVK